MNLESFSLAFAKMDSRETESLADKKQVNFSIKTIIKMLNNISSECTHYKLINLR